jgi:hypothetical protein
VCSSGPPDRPLMSISTYQISIITRARTQKCNQCVYPSRHSRVLRQGYAHMCMYLYAYTHTHTQTYIYTHTYIYIYIIQKGKGAARPPADPRRRGAAHPPRADPGVNDPDFCASPETYEFLHALRLSGAHGITRAATGALVVLFCRAHTNRSENS